MHPSRQRSLSICLEVFELPHLSCELCPTSPPAGGRQCGLVLLYHSFIGHLACLSVMAVFSIALVLFTDDTAHLLGEEEEDEAETRCVASERTSGPNEHSSESSSTSSTKGKSSGLPSISHLSPPCSCPSFCLVSCLVLNHSHTQFRAHINSQTKAEKQSIEF